MTEYEKLLSNANDNDVTVYDDYNLKGTRIKGLYCDGTVAISNDLRTQKEKACVLGMPVKDTIKLTDENGKIRESPRRDLVWQAQTPQAFAAELLFPAFEKLMQHSTEGITDDAMVVEQEMGIASVMVKGGYENIKITTPEDMLVAESFLAEK